MRRAPHRAPALALAALAVTGCRAPSDRPLVLRLAPSATHLPAAGTEVALDLSRVVPRVEVEIDGRGPFVFLVDTGAPYTSVTAELAATLSLPDAGLEVADPRGALGTVRLGTVQLGAAELSGIVAVVSEGALTHGTDGILGFTAFHQCVSEFDFPRGRLRLHPGSIEGLDGGGSTLADEGPPHRPIVGVSFERPGGEPVRHPFLLDTGSDSGIFLPASAGELPFPAVHVGYAEVATSYGAVHWDLVRLETTARLGGIALERPVVSANPRGPDVFPERVGLIGMRLLGLYRVCFDPRRRLVRFYAPEPVPSAAPQ